MVKTYPVGARLDPEVKEALERAAKADARSLSYLINKILSDWVAANVAPKPVRKRAVGLERRK